MSVCLCVCVFAIHGHDHDPLRTKLGMMAKGSKAEVTGVARSPFRGTDPDSVDARAPRKMHH